MSQQFSEANATRREKLGLQRLCNLPRAVGELPVFESRVSDFRNSSELLHCVVSSQ